MVLEKAVFAAGCFWSVELMYQRLVGVATTAVGYANGQTQNPTYKEVCSGKTGFVEAVQLEYDPSQITYKKLLDAFWAKHDPTTLARQGGDIGTQYSSKILYFNEEQKKLAIESRDEEQKKYKVPIVTAIEPFEKFYPAEEYHQKYLEKDGQSSAKMCTDKIACYGLNK
ncbi:peptide methionine sulfoxide reductase [Tieghemostelium lacteum]|uniref:peptide-methionine (S)-S-oxide reductase n=1 Tax=Tieghemostelium lacteum TaxID=361077 RepID=A0A151Z9X9_TIELA|nr:peptide methionine sulfoxide reductase [Tieghemostelium lacteum]|eukprot:KYQ90750.1 peptide methionine sulfoxide reductase [Tieghemostelium lacteum]